MLPYQSKNFDHLLGTPGFSEQLLKNHFTLYQGYVANTNKLADAIQEMTGSGKIGTPEYAELKRRFGWEFNGMRLHELYFGNMRPVRSQTPQASADAALSHRTSNGVKNGGAELDENSELFQKVLNDFGSYENWEKDFKGTGAMRGIGWTILYYDPEGDRMFNVWINEHDVGHLTGCRIVLVLDVFEHAYMLDYGIKRADYIDAFFKAIDWSIVMLRF